MASWKRVVEPSTEPVSVEELVAQLRLPEIESERSQLERFIRAATSECEDYSWMQYCAATWELTAPAFPCRSLVIRFPRPPLLALESIRYVDEDGETQDMDAATYEIGEINHAPAILLKPFQYWPTTQGGLNDVRIRWQAGWPDPTAVPERYRLAVLLRAGDWYRNRESAEVRDELPRAIRALLGPTRAFEF